MAGRSWLDYPGPRFNIRQDVFSLDLAKSGRRVVECWNVPIALKWHELRTFFPSHCSKTTTNMILHISARVWERRWSTNTRTVGFCVQNKIIIQWKCLYVPYCTYMESMLIKFTQMCLYNRFAMQAILNQFKRHVAAWKRLGCPQRMQRTWWQIVATSYTGFRWLTGTSALVLPRCLTNFKAIVQFWIRISWLRVFGKSYNKTSYRILKQVLSVYSGRW